MHTNKGFNYHEQRNELICVFYVQKWLKDCMCVCACVCLGVCVCAFICAHVTWNAQEKGNKENVDVFIAAAGMWRLASSL